MEKKTLYFVQTAMRTADPDDYYPDSEIITIDGFIYQPISHRRFNMLLKFLFSTGKLHQLASRNSPDGNVQIVTLGAQSSQVEGQDYPITA